jgi:hypothetical protein
MDPSRVSTSFGRRIVEAIRALDDMQAEHLASLQQLILSSQEEE